MTVDMKTRLLDSAERAVRSGGFDGFSYRDMAKDVGIRSASIHYHFPTKADLSVALLDRYHARFDMQCVEIMKEQETASAQLAALIDSYRAALQGGQCLCMCVAFSISRDVLPDETVLGMRNFRTMMIGWFTQVFATGIEDRSILNVRDPAQEAAAALALLEGSQLAARAEADLAAFERAVCVLEQRCL